mmetsp:Transcript_9399/g.24331  ORF Transcript_9399/g.24331 Transcript_9399/m.24331 type:complete len:601 (-) Transcript_9399:43-1845(-)
MVSPSLAIACRPLPGSDVLQLLWDLLARLLQKPHKLWCPFVLRRPQSQGAPCLAGTTGAPDAVDVALYGDARGLAEVAEVVDDDEGDSRDVEAAGRDVRGHEHGLLSTCHLGAELAEHLLALPLLLVAVDGPAPHSLERLSHLLLQKVARSLGRSENYRALVGAEALLKVVLQLPNLLLELARDHLMRHALVQSELVPSGSLPDANLDSRLARESGGDGLHLLGPRRREKQRLPLGATTSSAGTSALLRRAGVWAPCNDLTDGRFEAHVEHLVRLVEHEIGHRLQRDGGREAALGVSRAQVVQAAWRRDDDVRPLLERTDLLALWRASVQHNHARSHGGRKLLGLAGNLQRQLARGCHDEDAWTRGLGDPPRHLLGGRSGPTLGNAGKSWQKEAACFSAASLCHGHNVLASQGNWPRLRLNRARCGVTLRRQCLRKGPAKHGRSCVEGLERCGARRVDKNLMELPEGNGAKFLGGNRLALHRLSLLRISRAAQVTGACLPLLAAKVWHGAASHIGRGGLFGLLARCRARCFSGGLARCLLLCCRIDLRLLHLGRLFDVLRLRRTRRFSSSLPRGLCLIARACAQACWIWGAMESWTERHG